MNRKHASETTGTSIFILAMVFGGIFGGDIFELSCTIAITALFLFFAIVPGDGKPKKFEERD